MEEKFSLTKRLASFLHAFNGLRILLKEEHNARIHLAISILVITAGILLKISLTEWIILCLTIGFVITTETINTAIENLCDLITKEENKTIKKVKDLSAGAVLLSTIASVFVGFIIFIPKVLACF